jgi:putative ABC transport system permease protein
MTSLLHDLRFGLRMLLREKAFTALCLLTLALCIGANTTIFSVLDRILLRPLPYPEPQRLVELYNSYPNVGVPKAGNGVPDYFDRRQETAVFEDVALVDLSTDTIGESGSPERIHSLHVTTSLLGVLRVTPALGRGFTEEDGQIGHEKVVLLGQGLWQEKFGGRPDALGQMLRVDGTPYTVIGVLPAGFDFLETEGQFLMPMAFTDKEKSDDARHSNFARMLGRLRPGVTLRQAQERIDALNARILERFPKYSDIIKSAGFHTLVNGLFDETVQDIRPPLYLLQWGAALVLLIGCVNVANLLLIRATARTGEMAVRFALGAGRLRVARQLLTESLLLGLVGGGLGLLLAAGGIRALGWFGVGDLPRGGSVGLDSDVLLFALGLSALTGLVFGTIPVLHVFGGRVAALLRQTGRTGSPGKAANRTRAAFVLLQVSLAFVLLIGSGLLLLSFRRVLEVDPGFRPQGVLSAMISLPENRYKEDPAQRAFIERALEAVRALPGVQVAGMTSLLPFGGNQNDSVVSVEGVQLAPGQTPPVPYHASVDPAAFTALGIPLLDGRLLADTDTEDSEKVMLVDRTFARRYLEPGGSVIGRRIRQGVDEADNKNSWFRVVGVVGSVKIDNLDKDDDNGFVYFPYRQRPTQLMALVLKSSMSESSLAGALRAAILRIDPELPLYDVRSMEARVDRSLVRRRAPMMMLLVFAALALGLSAVGIYGVLAYSVAQQTKEIGIRLALGARPAQVLGRVLWRGGRLVLLGLGLGLAGAAGLSRLLESLLYGVRPTDPVVFGAAALLLGGVGVLACLVPSWQATRVDPNVALRYE